MKELIKIINDLKGVIESTDLRNISDKDLLDFALKIYITESINKQKNFQNNPNNSKSFSKPFSKEEPATDKQIKELKRLGGVVSNNMTKKEASKRIGELS